MLISIHMPKTAGLSFRAALEEHFGPAFRHDYGDFPLAQPAPRRREQARRWGQAAQVDEFAGVGCIHGHFLALKYLPLATRMPCTFVTWLREPLARLVSHYHYWLRSYEPGSPGTTALHRRVVEEGWSLARFCLAPELRNVYSEFLWGFPPQRLGFIGITERYDDDLRYFSQEILGNKLAPHTLNRRPAEPCSAREAELSESERAAVEAFHAADIALYRRALDQRRQRPGGSG